jgi:Fe-S cluster assembly ATP-binding protein
MTLEIKDLYVEVEGKEIIRGINLKIQRGEFHVLMGHNGSGKTTLAKTIMGHPSTKVTQGDILFDGQSIKDLSADKRAKLGLFLEFQAPVEVEGVGFVNFLRAVKESTSGSTVDMKQFMGEIREYTDKLSIAGGIIGRSLNQGFSGGEKKKAEILQMAVLKPKIAILDEPDSGLDIDAVKAVAESINTVYKKEKMGMLLITHYSRILSYMEPQFVHVMAKGKIVAEGNKGLIQQLEKDGYDAFVNQKE